MGMKTEASGNWVLVKSRENKKEIKNNRQQR